MKIKWRILFINIAIPLIVGGIAGFISKDSMSIFETLNKSPLSPPGWLFPVVWTILYTLMGFASYLVVTSRSSQKNISRVMSLYGVQLFFNFLWTFWFFNLGLYFFAFIWLVILWILILATMISFAHISKLAMYLMVPYLLWVIFAGYLNLEIALLN